MMRGTLSGASSVGGAITAQGGIGGALSSCTGRRSVQAFATAADMQAATDLFAGMVAHTNGFHASGDGGAAYYTISASGTANGMDVLALQNGLKATFVKNGTTVNVMQLGAKPDGTTDCMDPFNRAIALLDGGQRLYVPCGDFMLGQTFTISKSITFECDGRITVSHAAPVLVLDGVVSANVSVQTIVKNAMAFDYEEGSIDYSIGVLVKDCMCCNIGIGTISNITTGVVLCSVGSGCFYNSVSVDNTNAFTGIELVNADGGGAINGNTVQRFVWRTNTWQGNTSLVPSYMIKSLSYGSTPYVNNGNAFNGLFAEYGARAANYTVCLVKLDYATHCTFQFDRVEILPKDGVGFGNSFLFTNSTWCSATLNSVTLGIVAAANVGTGTHNYIYDESELANMGKVVNLLGRVTLNASLSYTSNWFVCALTPANKTVRIQGELVASSEIPNGTQLITGLPKGRAGFGVMKIAMGTTATLWNAPTNVTFYKLSAGGQNQTTLNNRGVIPSGTRLYVDIEYFVDDSEL